MVVGDFNDLNLMFSTAARNMLFIDVDSFQVGAFPCVVGTEAFLDPILYGVNLADKAVFTAENDWYSFAVLLFKSLLLAHPYGGVHPKVATLTGRAIAGISILNKDVVYPRIAYAADLLSDDLRATFEEIFSQKRRGVFSEATLDNYAHGLKPCPFCGAAYPAMRTHCPMCSTPVPVTVQGVPSAGEVLINADGQIIAWGLHEGVLRAIAHENGKAVLYTVRGRKKAERHILFDALPEAQYAFLGDSLVISPNPESEDILIVGVQNGVVQGIAKTSTSHYGGTQPVFASNGQALYRLAGGYLMRGQLEHGELVERAVMAAAEGQTWFQVASNRDQVFGFFRAYQTYAYFFLTGGARLDIPIPALENGEILLESHVYFNHNRLLLLRQTQYQGMERVRLDEIDDKGRLLHSQISPETEAFTPLAAHAYGGGVLLQATDQGVRQERLETGLVKVFAQTAGHVQHGDWLLPYENGLAIRKDTKILLVTI
jgi:hypothetical protein